MIGRPYNNRGSTSAPSSALVRGVTSAGTDTRAEVTLIRALAPV